MTYTLAVADLTADGRARAVGLAVVHALLEDAAALSAAGGRDGVSAEEGDNEGGEDGELHVGGV